MYGSKTGPCKRGCSCTHRFWERLILHSEILRKVDFYSLDFHEIHSKVALLSVFWFRKYAPTILKLWPGPCAIWISRYIHSLILDFQLFPVKFADWLCPSLTLICSSFLVRMNESRWVHLSSFTVYFMAPYNGRIQIHSARLSIVVVQIKYVQCLSFFGPLMKQNGFASYWNIVS